MDQFHEVLVIIEKLRQEMNAVAGKKGIRDPEVLIVSKKLDEIINQYQELFLKEKR